MIETTRMKNGTLGKRAGFTLVEMALACTVAMILMFGALYSSTEAYSIVREGDTRVHTHLQARRTLDRFLRDCRYAEDLAIEGKASTGWLIAVTQSGLQTPSTLQYRWDAASHEFQIEDDTSSQIALSGLLDFELSWQTEVTETGSKIAQVTAQWTVAVNPGLEAGFSEPRGSLELGGSIRRY